MFVLQSSVYVIAGAEQHEGSKTTLSALFVLRSELTRQRKPNLWLYKKASGSINAYTPERQSCVSGAEEAPRQRGEQNRSSTEEGTG